MNSKTLELAIPKRPISPDGDGLRKRYPNRHTDQRRDPEIVRGEVFRLFKTAPVLVDSRPEKWLRDWLEGIEALPRARFLCAPDVDRESALVLHVEGAEFFVRVLRADVIERVNAGTNEGRELAEWFGWAALEFTNQRQAKRFKVERIVRVDGRHALCTLRWGSRPDFGAV